MRSFHNYWHHHCNHLLFLCTLVFSSSSFQWLHNRMTSSRHSIDSPSSWLEESSSKSFFFHIGHFFDWHMTIDSSAISCLFLIFLVYSYSRPFLIDGLYIIEIQAAILWSFLIAVKVLMGTLLSQSPIKLFIFESDYEIHFNVFRLVLSRKYWKVPAAWALSSPSRVVVHGRKRIKGLRWLCK